MGRSSSHDEEDEEDGKYAGLKPNLGYQLLGEGVKLPKSALDLEASRKPVGFGEKGKMPNQLKYEDDNEDAEDITGKMEQGEVRKQVKPLLLWE